MLHGTDQMLQNDRELSLNGTGWAMVNDGCYGNPGSVVIVGCLSTDDLTGKTFQSFPTGLCSSYWGYCTHLNDIWVAGAAFHPCSNCLMRLLTLLGVEGCVGPVWVNNYRDSDDFIDAAGRLLPSASNMLLTFAGLLFVTFWLRTFH